MIALSTCAWIRDLHIQAWQGFLIKLYNNKYNFEIFPIGQEKYKGTYMYQKL